MFDIGFWEMAFIGVIALIVIGPERLPRVARTAGTWMGKGRRMINEVKADVKKEMKEYDIQQIKEFKNELDAAAKDLGDISKTARDSIRNEAGQISNAVQFGNKKAKKKTSRKKPTKQGAASKKPNGKNTVNKGSEKKSPPKRKSSTKKNVVKKTTNNGTTTKKVSGKKSPARKRK